MATTRGSGEPPVSSSETGGRRTPWWRRKGWHNHIRRDGFLKRWLRHTWLDLVTLAILGGLTLGIHFIPDPFERVFPITFLVTGDVIRPDWAYPIRESSIKPWLAGLISLLVPILVIAISQFRVASAWDLSHGVFGVIWSNLIGQFVSVTLKLFVGGLRPNFFEICRIPPDASGRMGSFSTLDGSGFQRIMFTKNICTQCDKSLLKNAMTSFPSGHAVAYFAGFGFLFFWLNAKLKIWSDHKPSFWKLILAVLSLILAAILSTILVIENQHHWYDAIAGALIGLTSAWAVFRLSYASVWDWRHNHYPLDKAKPYDYKAWRRWPVLTDQAGWGTSSRVGKINDGAV